MKKFILVLGTVLVLTAGVSTMAIGDFGKVCLFSAISGVITLDGKPVANARLIRTADYQSEKSDETTTDDKGYFQFPALYERTIAKYLPMEFVAGQEIVAYYQNQEYKLWIGVKRTPEENAESRGKPLIVTCELNNAASSLTVNHSVYITSCRWNVEPDPKKVWREEDFFDNSLEQQEK